MKFFRNSSDTNLLIRIDVLLIEWHKGSNRIEEILLENDFRYFTSYESISGMIML
jgi:hypothetical protein